MVLDTEIRSKGRRSSSYLWKQRGKAQLPLGHQHWTNCVFQGTPAQGKKRRRAVLALESLLHMNALEARHKHRLFTNIELCFYTTNVNEQNKHGKSQYRLSQSDF